MEVRRQFNWTPLELDEYDYAAMREQDERGIKALAVRRAEEKGMEAGLEKGMAAKEAMMEATFVNRLHSLGNTPAEIERLTGLSMERIREILGF